MARKLVKITKGQLFKGLATFSTQYLHFVLKDNTVRLLKVQSLDGKKIIASDTKHHRIIINLPSIEEIWTESELTVAE